MPGASGSADLKEITDPAVLIYEFFSMRYNRNIKLSDLAAFLNYSEKHTERLLKKHTGMTFKNKLIEYRMKTAGFLRKSTAMTMTEIAGYVGYSNYSGFWKARKEFLKNSGKNV